MERMENNRLSNVLVPLRQSPPTNNSKETLPIEYPAFTSRLHGRYLTLVRAVAVHVDGYVAVQNAFSAKWDAGACCIAASCVAAYGRFAFGGVSCYSCSCESEAVKGGTVDGSQLTTASKTVSTATI